jgi:hypothetical protein
MLTMRFFLILVVYGWVTGHSLGLVEPAALQTSTPPPLQIGIDDPLPGTAIQGVTTISGSTNVEGFQTVEVAFAYQSDPTTTWFLISQGSEPVEAGVLAGWDTTTISDGNYLLRVQVFLQNGTVLESRIEGLRVRNYLQIETPTPAAEISTELILPTATPSPLPDYRPSQLTPEAMPTNPAQVTPSDLGRSVTIGMIMVVGALMSGAVYAGIKAYFKR